MYSNEAYTKKASIYALPKLPSPSFATTLSSSPNYHLHIGGGIVLLVSLMDETIAHITLCCAATLGQVSHPPLPPSYCT